LFFLSCLLFSDNLCFDFMCSYRVILSFLFLFAYKIYKILFGLTSINSSELFELRQSTTRGHPYKLFKSQCTSVVGSSFFTQRIINVWNDLPVNRPIVNFSSMACFKRSLDKVNFSCYLVLT